jgi:HD-like signal output (HDOD) protein
MRANHGARVEQFKESGQVCGRGDDDIDMTSATSLQRDPSTARDSARARLDVVATDVLGTVAVRHDADAPLEDDLVEEGVDALTAFVSSVEHLPLFTGMAAQLIQSVDDDEVTGAELSRMISGDAALVVHLLRIVNSPYYGLSRRIGTVTEACTVLGLNLVRRTVTVAVLQRPLFAYLHDTAVARSFWKHELLCAALSRHIGQRAGLHGEFCYMAGLLHDVGRLTMLMRFPDCVDLLLRPARVAEHGLGPEEELAMFGFTHAQVGGALLELWGLPGGIVQAAHQHMDDVEPEDPMAAAVWRANLIAHEFGDDEDDEAQLPWMEAIGLDAETRRRMIEEIETLGVNPG